MLRKLKDSAQTLRRLEGTLNLCHSEQCRLLCQCQPVCVCLDFCRKCSLPSLTSGLPLHFPYTFFATGVPTRRATCIISITGIILHCAVTALLDRWLGLHRRKFAQYEECLFCSALSQGLAWGLSLRKQRRAFVEVCVRCMLKCLKAFGLGLDGAASVAATSSELYFTVKLVCVSHNLLLSTPCLRFHDCLQ